MGKLLKSLLVILLVFCVLYAALSFYFINAKGLVAKPTASAPDAKVTIEQLMDRINTREQRIHDLLKEPTADNEKSLRAEEAEIAVLTSIIDSVKKGLFAKNKSDDSVGSKKLNKETLIRFFVSEKKKPVIVVLLCFLLIFLISAIIREGVGKKKSVTSVKPIVKHKPQLELADDMASKKVTLEDTVAKFREAASITTTDTQTAAETIPDKNSLIEMVFELSRKGYSVEEIASKAHIDQDQVRLILKFKQ